MVSLTEGMVIDFAIDPDGAGNFDPADPLGTIGLVTDGSDRTEFAVRLQEIVQFIPDGLTGDYNGNGELDVEDLDLQAVEIASGLDPPEFDLTGDGFVNDADRIFWLHDLKGTWVGDADLNGLFDSGDFVAGVRRRASTRRAKLLVGRKATGTPTWSLTRATSWRRLSTAATRSAQFPGAVQAVPEPSCGRADAAWSAESDRMGSPPITGVWSVLHLPRGPFEARIRRALLLRCGDSLHGIAK